MSSGGGATSPNNNCKVLQESYLDTLDTFELETDANGAITVNVISEDKCFKEEADAGVTFYIDEEGRYYYQQSGENQDIELLNCKEYEDNTEATQQALQGQVLGGEGYQTVTLAPSEGGAESCYVVVVQDGTEPVMFINTKTEQDEDQVNNVYEFDEEEEESAQEEVSDDKESIGNFSKSASVVKPTISVERQRFRCSHCPYVSHKRYLLMRHLNSHSSDRPHKCYVCERGFKTVASLRNHVNFHNGIKPFVCKYCKKTFTTSGELVRHVRYRHTHVKPHKCEECDYASVELSKLRRHIRCHTGERPYQCPHCTYASADTFKMKRHIRTHTGEKPYKCDVCNMCFTQSNSLNGHKLIHMSKKPVFQCEICPTKLGRKNELRIHLQNMHYTSTPIKCKKCGKSFTDRYSHKMHARTHKGEKCFKCEVCPYASAVPNHLKSHMLTHTDEKPFGCDQCDQSFRQKQLLRRHENLYHNSNYVQKPAEKKAHTCHKCKRTYARKGNLIRHLATHDFDSGHKKKASALKLGRMEKIKVVDGSPDSGNEPEQILKLHLEGSKLKDGPLVMVESCDGEQYAVVEVIQIEDDKQQYGSVPIYADDEQDDNNSNEIHLHSKRKGIDQAFKFEKDLDTNFGFDEEDGQD